MASAYSYFDSFSATTNFDSINHIDNPTWKKRKIYTKDFWIVYPNKHFGIRLGETKPNFICFLKTTGELFGDPITPLNIADYSATFKCFDQHENLIVRSLMTNTDSSLGEFTYYFKSLDFSNKGRYYAEIEFKTETTTMTLPTPGKRIEIIVI